MYAFQFCSKPELQRPARRTGPQWQATRMIKTKGNIPKKLEKVIHNSLEKLSTI